MKVSVLKTTGILAVATASLVAVSCGKGDGQTQQAAPAPTIATMTLTTGSQELESTYPTIIKGKTDIAIRPQVTGFITKVHVDEGQQVKKGQTLFTLDQVQFQAAVDQAMASVNAAQTAVHTAQLTADTKKQLYDKDIISQYEWQLADNQLQTAKAQLAQAQAALINAQKNLAYTVVTAPSDGVVGSIPAREGSLASPSSTQPLTTVSDNSQVYAYFSLTEKDLLDLTNNGQRSLNEAIASMPSVSLRLADGTLYPEEGKVATVSGVIDNATGSASVRALFNNPSGLLRSGSTGNILIPVKSDSVIIIPQSSTYELQDRRFVYVVNDSNVVKSTPITVNALTDGQTFVVTSGLQPGERIVLEGVGTSMRDGLVINPFEKSAEPAK